MREARAQRTGTQPPRRSRRVGSDGRLDQDQETAQNAEVPRRRLLCHPAPREIHVRPNSEGYDSRTIGGDLRSLHGENAVRPAAGAVKKAGVVAEAREWNPGLPK